MLRFLSPAHLLVTAGVITSAAASLIGACSSGAQLEAGDDCSADLLGCPAGTTCTPVNENELACLAAGTLGFAEPCELNKPMQCKERLTCTVAGCRELCEGENPCDSTQTCDSTGADAEPDALRYCMPPDCSADPFVCKAGSTCDTSGRCAASGPGKRDHPCSVDTRTPDCQDGLVCISGYCAAYCDDAHPCRPGERCEPFGSGSAKVCVF